MNEQDIPETPDLAALGFPIEDDADEENVLQEGQDEEAGPDGEADEHAPEPEDDAPAQQKRDQAIPRARFDEVNAKLHAERYARAQLEEQLEAMRQQSAKQPAEDASGIDLKALKRQVFDLRLTAEGEEEADRIEDLIESERDRRAVEKAMAAIEQREQARSARERAVAAAAEAEELGEVAARVVAQYPWLDSVSGTGDQKAIQEVMALRSAYHSSGMTLSDALVEAAGTIAKARGAFVADATPIADKRTQAARTAAARTSVSQPPRASEAGIGNRAVPNAAAGRLNDIDAWTKASPNDPELQRLLA